MSVAKKARTTSGVTKYAGSFGTAEVLHLLKRTMFGATKADLDHFKGMSMDDAVDAILNVDYTPPSPPLNYYNSPSNSDPGDDPNVNLGQTWVNDYNGTFNGQRMSSFKRWWVGQMVNQDRTIREKMVLFWHNHFATETNVYGWPNYAYDQNAMLRANCLKNFRDLVKGISIDKGMLVYLNGYRNTKTAPDENYARELQELFTLGKGPDSEFTEEDVRQAAKVLTGWRINWATKQSEFQSQYHDESNKQFSSFYNNTVIFGKTGSAGADELDALISMIFNQVEVSKYIARKLYRWFIYYDIDEAAEANVITPLANTFRNGGFEIKPVLAQLFKSEHFFDTANRGALIKSPIDFSVGMIRQFDVPNNSDFPPASKTKELYTMFWYLQYYSAIQQQDIGDPPSVAGWPAYYQIPQYHELWINSDTLPNRNKVTDYISMVGYTVGSYKLKISPGRFADQFSSVSDPKAFINDMVEFLFTLDVNQDQLDFMRSILLGGQTQDYYWTNEWTAYKAGTANSAEIKLAQLFKYMMGLAEYQLS